LAICKLEPEVGREVISRENSLISNLSDESIEAVGCDAKADSETKLQSPIENLVAADSEDIASNLNPESLAVNVYAEIMLNLWDSQLKSLSNKIEYSPSHQKHIDSFSNSLELKLNHLLVKAAKSRSYTQQYLNIAKIMITSVIMVIFLIVRMIKPKKKMVRLKICID
jgi:hypothetical protein